MNIPKIQFKEMTLQENIDLIKWAYFENTGQLDVHYYTIQYFPELANITSDLSKEEVYEIIEQVVTHDYNENKEKIKQAINRYNSLWSEYNDKYFLKLSEYLKVDWPNNINVIEGTVGMIPIFPRYLDSFSFSVNPSIEDWQLIKVCAHETLHFLWFEKWKKIHPETPRREYDSPYITWQYSEMVTDPILNSKPFSDMFDFVERGYDAFYELTDDDGLVMDKLRNIYGEGILIEEKIDKGFTYIKDVTEKSKSF